MCKFLCRLRQRGFRKNRLTSMFPRNLPGRDPTPPLLDIEQKGQVFLQEGPVLLIWNKFDGLARGEPANAGKSGVEWSLWLLIIQGVRQKVVDCLIHYVAVALYGPAHDCAKMFDEQDAHQASFFVNLAQGGLLK